MQATITVLNAMALHQIAPIMAIQHQLTYTTRAIYIGLLLPTPPIDCMK